MPASLGPPARLVTTVTDGATGSSTVTRIQKRRLAGASACRAFGMLAATAPAMRTAGAIFGVVALKLLDELVTVVGPILGSAFAPQIAASLGLIMRGMVIILFLIFEPRGLAHRWERIKTYYRRWPFSYQ